MKDCIFCELVNSDLHIWSDDNYYAIKNINPEAETHLLVLPKEHLDNLDAVKDGDGLISAVQQVAAKFGLSQAYRIAVNVGEAGGQEINHLHIHILSDQRVVSDDQIG